MAQPARSAATARSPRLDRGPETSKRLGRLSYLIDISIERIGSARHAAKLLTAEIVKRKR